MLHSIHSRERSKEYVTGSMKKCEMERQTLCLPFEECLWGVADGALSIYFELKSTIAINANWESPHLLFRIKKS